MQARASSPARRDLALHPGHAVGHRKRRFHLPGDQIIQAHGTAPPGLEGPRLAEGKPLPQPHPLRRLVLALTSRHKGKRRQTGERHGVMAKGAGHSK
jgi:hypothetical protein